MKKIFYISLLFILAMLCKGCALRALPSEPITFRTQNSPNGLIFGSITFPKEKPNFNGYFILIQRIYSDKDDAEKKSTEIHIKPEQIWKVKHKGELDNGLTYLFAIEKREGKYEIPSIRLFSNSGFSALQSMDYVTGFTIPFDVKKGEITYVGNIIFNEYGHPNDTLVTYINNFDRDINALKNFQPSVDWDKAIKNPEMKIEYY